MMRMISAGLLLMLASCAAPADEQYCGSFGFPKRHPEYVKCMGYFHEQQVLFDADRRVCEFEADGTYPPTLYDYGHWEHIHGGYGPHGWYGGQTVRVSPDYARNAQVDSLRMRIIQPCMQQHGWVSGSSWQAGRMPVKTDRTPRAGSASLPWRGK